MRTPPILAGLAAGVALAAGTIAGVELSTQSAEAQRAAAIGQGDLVAANRRASAAINGYKNLSNRLGKFVAEPEQLIGAESGPIRQDRGVGGGLPTDVIADSAITEPKLGAEVRNKLNTDASLNGAPAGGALAGTYPDPGLAPGSVGPEQLGTPIAARLRSVGNGTFVPAGVLTPLNLGAPEPETGFDTAGMFDPANPTVVTVPRAGIYRIGASVGFDNLLPANGTREVFVRRIRGGVPNTRSVTIAAPLPPGANSFTVVYGSRLSSALAGDQFAIVARQTNSMNLGGTVLVDTEIDYLGPLP